MHKDLKYALLYDIVKWLGTINSFLACLCENPLTNAIKDNYCTICLCLCHMRELWAY